MIKFASFNVNSVKARLPRLIEWLSSSKPDVVCLQELKCEEQNFPYEQIADLGYNCAVFGQKTYNGVAVLSKYKIEEIYKDFPEKNNYLNNNSKYAAQARYIEVIISVKNEIFRVSSIYVPNGGSNLLENQTLEDSDKFKYKMNFFDQLHEHLQKISQYDEMQIFAGDFNVACETIDIYDPKKFDGQILFHSQERQKFRKILNLGLVDIFRSKNPHSQAYSWWDYRGNSYTHNKGARIDYILCSPNIADRTLEAHIEDKGIRDQEKPSDHCPVSVLIK